MDKVVDILHPLASLEWRECREPPVDIGIGAPAQAVCLKDKVYMGEKVVHGYSTITHSWIQVADNLQDILGLYYVPFSGQCAVVLPSNELMVLRINKAYRVVLNITPFNRYSQFSMRALSILEELEIPVMTSLNIHTHLIQSNLGFLPHPTCTYSLKALLDTWLGGGGSVRPLIRQLHLDDFTQQIETYLSGVTVKQHPKQVGERERVVAKEGGGDLESQLSSRDDFIYQLKQEMAMLLKLNKELKAENELLRSQPFIAPIRKEDATDVEEKPLALVSVKTEVKEEIVMETKAEPTPFKSTTVWDLRGVEVCGEMTVAVSSSQAQQIEWKGFGLKLTIHEGCLPADVQECVITIKASLTGQYEFPENSHLVSAVFWLRCEPMCKFTKPITVEIQHCASSENLNQKFVRAACSQKQLPYTFKQLRGNFTSHSSYGVIELNSFSGLAITQEGSEDREYCLQLFYFGQPNRCKIDFVVTWNLEAHITVVKEEYERKGAVLGLHQPVEFESDAISLDIPMEGVTISGWVITPLVCPVVTKKQVDNFIVGKLIPGCHLMAEVLARRKNIPTLSHRVSLIGAKCPYNFFTIDLPFEVEEKPLAPVSLKTEPKEEEVVMETKAEPSLSQSTTVWDLRGVEVCGEMTVVVSSSQAQQIEWKGFGLKLTIHEGCLPADVQECVITIKASLAGQYEFPENSHLVSAVFWLRCEPMCKFTKPITVEIQHCARSENVANLNLKFVRAVCSQKQLPYTFKQLRGNFTSHSSYGAIELNSFSGLAVTQKGSEDREYCSQLFYLGQPNRCKIHFVVTWNLKAHLTAVKKEYERKGAVLGLYQPVDFESETITLDIPEEGATINSWKITPLISPVLTKKQVDNFRVGKLTPCCQLKAEVLGKMENIPTLKYRVSLIGAKYPNKFFTIDLPFEVPNYQAALRTSPTFGDVLLEEPDQTPQRKRGRFEDGKLKKQSSKSSASTNRQSCKPDLKDAFKELVSVATQWKTIGTLLGLPAHVLDKIKSDEDSVNDRLLTMLSEWLKQTADPHLSWSTMADALEVINSSKAEEIRQRYGHGTS